MYKYAEEIRDFINKPRKRYNLLKNLKFWNQLCSSLDVIEDSDLALDAYVDCEFAEDHGVKYLTLYGALQALFLQQDAVSNLCESLCLPNDLIAHPKLKEIRDIRNDSIGHPTKRGSYKSYHFISRPTIAKCGFTLISNYKNYETTFRQIFVIDLIKEQRKYLSEILDKIINSLKAEEKSHKERFKMEKLESIFPDTSYFINKIIESTHNSEQAHLGLINLKQIKKIMDDLKESLAKRGIEIDTYVSIKSLYEWLEYPVSELEMYFKRFIDKQEPTINDKTAYIFACFVKMELTNLREIAKELDDEYSS